ncbi:hypothetical protein [Aeromicrobium sp. 179-A 4D2 NHS]|uniref:hypothetical protein n=1 Tax=Aeromicrobium sp. 179-A 4D2 NHS TaxID=3142375 RepID=UPI0039A0D921
MLIANTTVEAVCDWPDGTFVQGGANGIVFVRGTADSYETAFVEVHNDVIGFLRGEGDTVTEAEHAAWAKAQTVLSCESMVKNGDHEWEARGYRNGAGFCKACNRFGTHVFDISEVGVPCYVCGTKTNWQTFGTTPGTYLCEGHCLPGMQEPYWAAALLGGSTTDEVFAFYGFETRARFATLMERFTLEEIAGFLPPEHLKDADFNIRWAWMKDHEQQWADRIRDEHRSDP